MNGNAHNSHEEDHLAHSRERSRSMSNDRDVAWDAAASHTTDTSRALNRVNWIYFLLGAAILLPWNAVITATPFFLDRLQGSPLRSTFSSYFSAVYQTSSFISLTHASYTAAQASKNRRIVVAHIIIALTLVALFVSTLTPTDPISFFLFSLSLGGLQASAGTYFLTSVVAYAAYFGPMAMQSVMSGQAAVAVVVSTIQLITTLSTVWGKPSNPPPSTPGTPPVGDISASATYFFGIATIGMFISFIGYRKLTRMRLFKRTVAKFEDRTLSVDQSNAEYAPIPANEESALVIPTDSATEEEDEGDLMAMSTSLNSLRERERELGLTQDTSVPNITRERNMNISERLLPDEEARAMEEVEPLLEKPGSAFWHVWRVNAMYNIAVTLIYVVTLSIFPPITSSVRSVSPTANPQIFIAVHFLIYNIADWLGRYACSFPRAQVWSRKKLMVLSVSRIAFVVLFLLCNVNLGPSTPNPGTSLSEREIFSQGLLQARSWPIKYRGRQWPPRSPGDTPFINSDFIFFVLLFFFGFSNGWLTSLIMMAAPSLEHNKRMKREWVDLAAVGASFSLAAGLVIGSISSFAIRGVMCGCNPFVQ